MIFQNDLQFYTNLAGGQTDRQTESRWAIVLARHAGDPAAGRPVYQKEVLFSICLPIVQAMVYALFLPLSVSVSLSTIQSIVGHAFRRTVCDKTVEQERTEENREQGNCNRE